MRQDQRADQDTVDMRTRAEDRDEDYRPLEEEKATRTDRDGTSRTDRPMTDQAGESVADRDGEPVAERDESPMTGRHGEPMTDRDDDPTTDRDESPVTGRPMTDRDDSPVTGRDGERVAERDGGAIAGWHHATASGHDGVSMTQTEQDSVTAAKQHSLTDRDGPGESTEDDEPHVFQPGAAERFRTEWQRIQARFVDDPRTAVRDADQLVTEVMDALAQHKRELEGRWQQDSTETEELRLALRSYRSFLNQLLNA